MLAEVVARVQGGLCPCMEGVTVTSGSDRTDSLCTLYGQTRTKLSTECIIGRCRSCYRKDPLDSQEDVCGEKPCCIVSQVGDNTTKLAKVWKREQKEAHWEPCRVPT